MTDAERKAIVGYLKGKGWVKLRELRCVLEWPQSARFATDLGLCINKLRREGVIRTTPKGEAGFAVCLTEEVLL